MPTPNSDRSISLRQDDSGAIMVMGIFMCTCLVAALWYLAAIGDSVLYRERLQEASDAVVFSDAVLHARGMNLIVLLNLIMACVLGVRVALKVAQMVCAIAGAIFFGIGLFVPPFMSAAEPCLHAAVRLQQLIDDTRPTINNSLKSLSRVQKGLAAVVPGAAAAGSIKVVGDKYEPFVPHAVVLDSEVVTGLPVTRGSEEKLCKEAGSATGAIFGWVLDKEGLNVFSGASTWLSEKMGAIAKAAPSYFCEMGTVGAAPDTIVDGMLGDSAVERCKDGGPMARYRNAEAEWEAACKDAGVTCRGSELPVPAVPLAQAGVYDTGRQAGTTTPDKQRKLDELRKKRDDAAKELDSYFSGGGYGPRLEQRHDDDYDAIDEGQCQQWAVDQGKKQYEASKAANAQSGADTDDMTGKKVVDGWFNGGPDAQFVGGVTGDSDFLKRSVGLVRVGAVNKSRLRDTDAPTEAKLPAFSQAELFFDCEGPWSTCNKDEDAMWHLTWRARLKRYDGSKPLDRLLSVLAVGTSMKNTWTAAKAVYNNPGLSAPVNALAGNTRLRGELGGALLDPRIMTQGVH